MIGAKHHTFIYPFFQWLTKYLIRRKFEKVNIIGKISHLEKPILLIANHVSWWDGFWVLFLNMKIFNKKIHFMMREDQLKKHWYFQYTGGYSIKKGTKSILESLQYTQKLLQNNSNLVLMFPQGEINSMHNTKFKFERGIERIISNKATDFQIIFVANLIDYFSKPKPELFIYFEEATNNISLEETYQSFYNYAHEQQKALKS